MAAKKPAPKKDTGEADVQAQVDAEEDQGFVGEKADPTPNENYTVQGVVAGKPTPENPDKG